MSEVTLTASTGRETGTRPSRRARAEGQVPAVVYGGGEPAVSVTVDRRELRRVLSTDAGINALITLSVDGDRLLTVVKDLQRHPVRRDVTHVDFLKVDASQPIEVEIPIRLVGEAKEVATNGGITEQRLTSLRVLVRPDGIPDSVEVDITDLTLTTSIQVRDIALPDGVTAVTDEDQAVVTAELTRAAVTGRDEEGEEGEGAAGAEGSEPGAEDSGGDDAEG